MRKGMASFFAGVIFLGGVRAAPAQQPTGQVVRLGEGETLTISGFINATLYNDRGRFASFGQGQNSEFSVQNQVGADQSFTDGDFRNTRLRFDFAAQPVLGKWAPKATVEVDFFGAFNGSPPFGDEQPQMRGRVIYADLTNGRTTVRIGQDWSPSFAETPVSLTHIAFPLGYGASGKIGWRFPGVFLFQDLSATGAPLTVQLQLAAMKGSGPIAPGNARDAGAGRHPRLGGVGASGLRLHAALELLGILRYGPAGLRPVRARPPDSRWGSSPPVESRRRRPAALPRRPLRARARVLPVSDPLEHRSDQRRPVRPQRAVHPVRGFRGRVSGVGGHDTGHPTPDTASVSNWRHFNDQA